MRTVTSTRIEQMLPELGPTMQRVARYCLEHPDRVLERTVDEVAQDVGVSSATVSRFAKTLGYGSYSQFRVALSSQLTRAGTQGVDDVEDTDTALQGAHKTLRANIEALRGTGDFLSGEDIEHAIRLVQGARTLGLFGLGSSNVVAQYAFHTWLRLPVNLAYNADYHMQLMVAAKLTRRDAALIVSHTGTDTDVIMLAEQLRARGVPRVVITSYPSSALAKLGDVHLSSLSEDTRFRAEALVSVTSQIGLVDVLYTELARRYGRQADEELLKVRLAVSPKHSRANGGSGGA